MQIEGDEYKPLSNPNIRNKTRAGRKRSCTNFRYRPCNQAVMIGAFRGRKSRKHNDRTTGAPMQHELKLIKTELQYYYKRSKR